MRKLQIALAIVFAAGVLMSGIGFGVAFGEYSSMQYGGTILIGEEDMVTEELVYEFTPVKGEKIVLLPCDYWNRDGEEILIEDSSVPMGQISYDVTYNPELSSPRLYFNKVSVKAEEDGTAERQEISGYLNLGFHYVGNDFELLMENKDQILEDMKQGKLASYEAPRIKKIQVRINPATKEYIKDNTRR